MSARQILRARIARLQRLLASLERRNPGLCAEADRLLFERERAIRQTVRRMKEAE